MPRVGVVGTLVWDTIHARDVGREVPTQEWGGIAYALSAFDAALPEGWSCFPIVKVGSDLREKADRFLSGLRRVDSLDGVRTVPEPNNRVDLHYQDDTRRCERLSGGVPGWSAEELWPLAGSCDALYVNFIAGWELDLAASSGLRQIVNGPLYADLHSLMLGIGPNGVRMLRPLKAWREWIASFDIVQMNEDELNAIAGGSVDPWPMIAEAIGVRTRVILVTLADRGAAWIATSEFLRGGPFGRRPADGFRPEGGAVVSGREANASRVAGGDPTGCGDVWGSTCFSSLLGGGSLPQAMVQANRFAARTAAMRGASGLAAVLRSNTGLLSTEDA